MKKVNWRHPFRREYQKLELCRPHHDWQTMLLLTAVLLAVVFLAYFWLDRAIKRLPDQPAVQSPSSAAANFSAAQIAQYANDLKLRRDRFEQNLKQPPAIADPSL